MKAQFYTKRYIVCPHCGKATKSSADHLIELDKLPTSFGPWTCDNCHEEYKGVLNVDHSIDIEKAVGGTRYLPVMDLLVIPPQAKPIYLLRHGHRHFKPGEVLNDVKDNARYYYNEHSCPTNWMDSFETIAFDGDGDPHGVIRYMDSIMPADFDAIEVKIKEQLGLTNGSSSGDSDMAILTAAFPQVAQQLDPDFVDDGILDLLGEPTPGKRIVTVSVKHNANEPGGPERYTVSLISEDGTEEIQASVRDGGMAVLIGNHLCREWRATLETDEHTKRFVTNL